MNRIALCLGVSLLAGCGDGTPIVDPDPTPGLDAQLRGEIARWGVLPIGPLPQPNPALVSLGQALMFDKVLSGNRDISCATCHQPARHGADGLSLAIGTGGTGLGPERRLGAGRKLIPRNAPSLLNQGLRSQYIFWDGRISGFRSGPFTTPVRPFLPVPVGDILTAQALFPVINREEMRGNPGDRDILGQPNELAQFADSQVVQVWQGVMARLLAIPEYVQMFQAAFPAVSPAALGFQHAAEALGAFQMFAFTRINSPFEQYLNRNDGALTEQEKRGALVFFQQGRCVQCHGGPLLGGDRFANDGVPQLGPGVAPSAPLDAGAGDVPRLPNGQPGGPPPAAVRFSFRVPPLRNVELTAPYMHNGVYPTLDAVVRHYNNVPAALTSYDVTQVAPELRGLYRGDAATIAAVQATLDFRLRAPMGLSAADQQDLVAFLRSLTDPAARDLTGLVPQRVPSGLPID